MEEIIVISCTNRQNSNTYKVSKIYEQILNDKNVKVKILDFCLLPQNLAFGELFGKRSTAYEELLAEYIVNNKKFIFVIPEYNGSFPGILKTFLDSIPPSYWTNKSACLVGVSAGRAGNLRGLDHLASILNYLKVNVYFNKLPISVVDKLLDVSGTFIAEDQLKVSQIQVNGFLEN